LERAAAADGNGASLEATTIEDKRPRVDGKCSPLGFAAPPDPAKVNEPPLLSVTVAWASLSNSPKAMALFVIATE
jgi:hypothetical protein